MQRTHWRWSWVRQGRQQADPRHTRPPPHQQLHRLPAGRGCWRRKDANSNIGWFLKPCFATRDAHDKGEGVEDPPKEPLKGEVRRSNKSSAPFCKRIILGNSQQRQRVCWRLVSKANKPSFSPAENSIEEGDKGKEGNEGAGNVANQKDRLATWLVKKRLWHRVMMATPGLPRWKLHRGCSRPRSSVNGSRF